MSESTKIEGLVKTAMDKVREMADCETVVGKPIVTADGTTIIPVSKISVGFASGGSDLPTKSTKETAIINMVPEVIDKITDFLGKKSDDEDEDEE